MRHNSQRQAGRIMERNDSPSNTCNAQHIKTTKSSLKVHVTEHRADNESTVCTL
jgi:hypothetical protein